ncbi:hypothetical protein MtrunA17_Chr1g0188731 [Medicago truncatula]|uniref:Plant/F9H3-4 protein n=1 Tax=Medicago truncatula TaxID=3880 RepID=A0A072VNB3_MEDTR|nr:uncharacterized protein LOC25484537 isoform X1 [Medicago truncatula]XP_024638706.1 uncharacterized protein LOC25484537 isoform X1 [Medicago truncatula]XP_024638710.1 uncharacterized protein LOC25484537 isoform X1 [Medicago truncatula]XP_024638717.1 uncharacterized protein LOC25484537 isoform X1 [Medicago truncatula]XP_039684727.1 uncharacterized protein LOC25484537 isoform X1 [Medicago truncatula]KEH42873.1 plant/F9H3-4 protein [Medicago truncatula]RHN80477.1 hypothetical protein MtrunA17_
MASSSCSGTSISNVDRFVLCVTPDVPFQTLDLQSCSHEVNSLWLPLGKDKVECFELKDLWDCYERWSALGAGTPILLGNGDALTQYYVPYLSSIQIYTSKSVAASRNRREDTDAAEFEFESSSEDDSGSDILSRSVSNNSSKAWDAVSLDSSSDQLSPLPTRNMLGYLYLQYTETLSPWLRVPFTEKITELAKSHPALMTLKSVDISPASWMAVAWYPIYSIPYHQPSEKELSACFLTYHTLSSSFQDCKHMYDDIDIAEDISCFEEWEGVGKTSKENKSGFMSLSPFGMAGYKLQEPFWLGSSSSSESGNTRMSEMYSAADSWLKQLNAHHHDFNFFTLRAPL